MSAKGCGVSPPARCPPRTQVSRLSHSSTRSTDSTLNIFLRWPQRHFNQPEAAAARLGVESEGSGSRPASGEPSLPSGRSRGADAGNRSALSPAPPSLARGRALPARTRRRQPTPSCASAASREPRPECHCARSRSLSPAPKGALPAPVHCPRARALAGPCGGARCVAEAPHCACADADAVA